MGRETSLCQGPSVVRQDAHMATQVLAPAVPKNFRSLIGQLHLPGKHLFSPTLG